MADSRGAQWTKLIFNAATNPIGALTRLPHGVACDQPRVRALISQLVAEGVAVAEAQGITLDSDPDALVDHAREVAYHHKASMLQDALARRRTEVAALNGGIVEFGIAETLAGDRKEKSVHETEIVANVGFKRAGRQGPLGVANL